MERTSELNNDMTTIQEAMRYVQRDDDHSKKALKWLLSLQTTTEYLTKDAIELNGVGFQKSGKYGSDTAKATKLVLSGGWTGEQRVTAYILLWKYRRQIVARMNGCKEPGEIARFKLSAIYDENSLKYWKAVQGR